MCKVYYLGHWWYIHKTSSHDQYAITTNFGLVKIVLSRNKLKRILLRYCTAK